MYEDLIPVEEENLEDEVTVEEENVIVNTGGTTDYRRLNNKPSINNVELLGNLSLNDLGIDQDFVKDNNYVHTDNNYTNEDKDKLSGLQNYDDTEIKELINGKQDEGDYATKDYVEQEIATFDFIKIVTELPETGLVNRTYFVPKTNTETNDLYDEYMWVDGKWELIGTKQIEVDLTDYVKNTDYASSKKAGVIKVYEPYGLKVVKGMTYIQSATKEEIDSKTKDFKPIVPKNLDYAVKKSITTNTEEWTDEEKASVKNMLGIGKWELITEVNLDTETAKYILCSCDEYDKIEIIIRRERNNTDLSGNMIFEIVDADGKTLVELYANSSPGYREKFSIMEVNGGYAHCISMSSNNTYASTSNLSRGYYVGKGCKYCLRIPRPNTACDGLSRMTVIGRRK